MAFVNGVGSVGNVIPTCVAGRHVVRMADQAEVYSSTTFPDGILRMYLRLGSGAGMEVSSESGGKHIHWVLQAHRNLSAEASRPAEVYQIVAESSLSKVPFSESQ